MLRYGAEIVGYEIREDFANRAQANVRSFLGAAALDRYRVEIADSYAGIDPAAGPFDRVVLDLPEPWQVVPHAEAVLRAGGVLVAYTPSIVQAARVSYGAGTRKARDDSGLIRYLMRHWHSTPFEMCEVKLHVKLPVFVARQWIRHHGAPRSRAQSGAAPKAAATLRPLFSPSSWNP